MPMEPQVLWATILKEAGQMTPHQLEESIKLVRRTLETTAEIMPQEQKVAQYVLSFVIQALWRHCFVPHTADR
jgi:hypothetical protein